MEFGLKKMNMNKKVWIALYAIVLLVHSIGVALSSIVLAQLTKPLLLIVLGYFFGIIPDKIKIG